MAKLFPDNPTDGDFEMLKGGKRFVFREGKWDLEPLLDRFKGDDTPGPILTDELPVIDPGTGDSVAGVGRVIEHTFSITSLEELETI